MPTVQKEPNHIQQHAACQAQRLSSYAAFQKPSLPIKLLPQPGRPIRFMGNLLRNAANQSRTRIQIAESPHPFSLFGIIGLQRLYASIPLQENAFCGYRSAMLTKTVYSAVYRRFTTVYSRNIDFENI